MSNFRVGILIFGQHETQVVIFFLTISDVSSI